MDKNELTGRKVSFNIIDEREVLGKEFKLYGTIDNPLFLAKNVADWIEYNPDKVNEMVSMVDDDEKLTETISWSGQRRKMWFLTEYGLYEVLMQSRKPIAKEFKKEVKQILKQIRLTGGYVQDNREEEFIRNYFPSFSEELKIAMVLELKTKADAYDEFLNTDGFISLNKAAKGILKGRNKMMAFLRGKEVLFKDGYDNLPYETYINRGYFRVVYRTGRNGKLHGTTHVSTKGIEFIRKLYKKYESSIKAVA